MQPQLLNPCSQADFPALSASYTATAGSTATWAPGPELVEVWADTACYVEVGEGVTATTASTPIPANTPVLIKLPLNSTGAPWRVSAIRVATNGIVYAKPMNRA